MKKNNLFKAVGIVILVYILMSWIVPVIYNLTGAEGDVSYQIGLVSIFSVILETFSGFGTVVLYVLLVGAFYGVLKVTGAYDKAMGLLSSKAKGREKLTLISIIIGMAVISSVSGLDLGLLIVYPILIGLIVKIGYDKLVALSATFGATIVGMYGATFAGTLYGVNSTILNLETFSQIWAKILFFVLGVAGLIILVLTYSKKNKLGTKKVVKADAKKATTVKKETKASSSKTSSKKTSSSKTTKKAATKSSAKNAKPAKVSEDVSTSKKTAKKEGSGVAALIVIGILFLLMFLGTTSWESIFGSNLFATFHDKWTAFTIGGFDVFNKLFGGLGAFGTWTDPMRFQTYSMLLIFAMIAIAIIYRTKIADCFEGFVDGIKSFVVPAILTILACSVFVFIYYNPVITPVTTLLLEATDKFNVALSGIYTIINSVFYVDYYYLAYSTLAGMPSLYEDASILSIISVMFTNLYSLVMLVAPTSVLLLVSLSISEVKYTDWFKFIWKLALALLVISFIVFTIMLLV